MVSPNTDNGRSMVEAGVVTEVAPKEALGVVIKVPLVVLTKETRHRCGGGERGMISTNNALMRSITAKSVLILSVHGLLESSPLMLCSRGPEKGS